MEALSERRCQVLVGYKKGERSKGCIRLRGAIEAQGKAIMSEVAFCLVILGVPSDVCVRTWVRSLRDRTPLLSV